MSNRWEQRAKKLEARKRKMKVEGRGLLTIEPLAIKKRLEKLQKKNANIQKRKK